MNKPKKVTLEMDHDQAEVLLRALDFYSRMGMGQYDRISEFAVSDFGRYEKVKDKYKEEKEVIEQVKTLYYPEIHPSSYYGIYQKQTPECARLAWDIYHVLRHDLSWFKEPWGGHTTNFHSYPPSTENPLVKVIIE